jgi:hypothetical protein
MKSKILFGFTLAVLMMAPALAYTIGDDSCDGTATTFPINISRATTYNNSPMNITFGDNIYFEGYNDTTDWFPEGFWVGFNVEGIPFNISEYEYVSFDVDSIAWTQDQYSGYFMVSLCNTTDDGVDEIEVCYNYKFNLDSMANEFKGSGNRLIATTTGCRLWNKSQPYYMYEDSDPCSYPELNYSEMRVFAWSEYGTLLPFSGTLGNFSFDTGENRLTSYDCADTVSLFEVSGLYGNLTTGWHLVDGIIDSYPTTETGTYTGYVWEGKKYSCQSGLSCSVRLVGSDGYTAGLFYFNGGLNITGMSALRDAYHNVTARVYYDGSILRYDEFEIQTDHGTVAELPRVLLEDYSDISSYLPLAEGAIYLNVLTKVTVPNSWYPVHRYSGSVYDCNNGSITFDSVDYDYSYCTSQFDFSQSPVTYIPWVSGYAIRLYHDYGTNLSTSVAGKTIIGDALSFYAYMPSDYYTNDNPSFSSFDIMGDGICGPYESDDWTAWNYSGDCASNFISPVFDTIGGLFRIVNESASLSGNTVAAMNTTDNTTTIAGIGILTVLALGFSALVWKGKP